MKAIYPAGAAAPNGSYSPAIISGSFLYLSGQIPTDPALNKIIQSNDIKEHVGRTMDNIKILVEAAGLTMDRLVKVTVYLKNIKDFAAYDEVYRTYFKGLMPARTTVEVSSFRDSRLVEIDAVAEFSEAG